MKAMKGKHFLHLQHGVGKVEGVRELSFGGQPSASYVQLFFPRDDLTVTVLEKDLTELVRNLVTAEEAKVLLKQVSEWKARPESSWKTRSNANQAALDSGDPLEYGKVAKNLAQLESEGSLRPCDKNHFNRSLDLLTEELSCALDKSQRQTRKLIDQAISTG
jgi:RNA polymerase-interacting CarD/CdnL/TRCF family regulator